MGDIFSIPSQSNPSSTTSTTTNSAATATATAAMTPSNPAQAPQSEPGSEPNHPSKTPASETLNQETPEQKDTILEKDSEHSIKLDSDNNGDHDGDDDDDDDEEGECPFCLFMKGGGCKDTFVEWEKCVEEGEKNNEDIVEKCFQATSALKQCMEAHTDYYAPILQAEKAAEDEAIKQLDEQKEKENEKESESNEESVSENGN